MPGTGVSKSAIQLRVVDLQNSTFRVYFSAGQVGTYLFQTYSAGQRQLLNSFAGKLTFIRRPGARPVRTNPLIHFGNRRETRTQARRTT